MSKLRTLEGADKLFKNLERIDKKYKSATQKKKMIRPGAKIVMQAIRLKAPDSSQGKNPRGPRMFKGILYKPGNLKASIKVLSYRRAKGALFVGPKVAGGKARADVTAFGAGTRRTDGFYAPFIEFGTSKMPARPFMLPGFNASKAAAKLAIQKAVADELKKIRFAK